MPPFHQHPPTFSSDSDVFKTSVLSSLQKMSDSEQHSSSCGNTSSVDSSENNTSSRDSEAEFSEDEETLIIRMFNLVGERWSLIAGRIPGRTAEEIEKYWKTRYSTSE